jgi:molecular chaperone DnaK (HSP70)
MSEYVVGIDLGTTHCALSSARIDHPVVRSMEIPQLAAPGEVAARALLPSFLYLAAPGELTDVDRRLPWGESPNVVGEAARMLGAKSPNRLVASAKSWVCHGGVDRRAPILPWNSPESEPHVSPFAAQVEYLAHMRAAWEAAHPQAPLAAQDVVVTVPASFDEGARELTSAAAREAGLGEVFLLEEPQAAFYDWLGAHVEGLARELAGVRLILVVDVGGGTTDLTLLRVRDDDGEPRIERIAVGGHLMLGGDNMDAALAVFALGKAGMARPEDASVWSALVQSARQAKERLLAADAPEQVVISVQARGSRLIGGTKSIAIERAEAEQVLLDGFLPRTGPAEIAARVGRAGLTTLGLPYTSDTAIVRHVCTFLRRHADAAREAGAAVVDGLPRPDRVLLNGGVFNAPALVERLMEVLAGWYGEPVARLEHTSLDLAVAHGAVRSALARRGIGEAIGGGTARAYYIGIDTAAGRKALCVAPRGLEAGASATVPDRVFELVLDQPVAFPLFAYTGDRVDAPGIIIDAGDELEPLPPLETLMRDSTAKSGATMPVTISTTLTEMGALEISLLTVDLPPRRYRLDFALKHDAPPAAEASAVATPPHPELPKALALVERAFAKGDVAEAKQIRATLEKALGPRGQWSGATCRALADATLERAAACGAAELVELHWMRLVGWCLRPGFGMPDDERRLASMWSLRDAGVRHRSSKANWAEWWILWRRVAAGLDAARQAELLAEVRPSLGRSAEMMQLAAVLERVPADDKQAIGELLLERADKLGSYWPLGRVGARVPFHGERTNVVPAAVVETWIAKLLALDLDKAEGASFALASIARMTGDARLDVAAKLRAEIAERLKKAKAPATWIDMVTRPTELSEGDRGRIFGDSLPAGLRLGA